MNCKDFNEIINDLADYRPMPATIREASVSHAALCPECAAKLADARAVGSCLLQAARAESEETPVRVKENLLAAFAEVQQQKSARAQVVDISSRRTRSWLAVAAAIAAVILLAVVISVWKKSAAPGAPQNLQAGDKVVNPHVDGPQQGSSQDLKKPDKREVQYVATRDSVTPRKKRRLLRESGSPGQVYETVARNTNSYLPLTYLAKGTDIESGTVVRVELSRAALASLGFTGSVDGSADSVRAEVILGDDGVARAIRLVD